jgi:hypothetical protein
MGTRSKWPPFALFINSNRIITFLAVLILASCSDFLEVDTPKNMVISETVFKDASTIESALANIYYQMREQGLVSGNLGMTTALGIYSDELDYYGFDAHQIQLFYHNVTTANQQIGTWWSQAYYLIYCANDILTGVEGSESLSLEEKNRFKSQALFIRAFIHSLLTDLFGDIPYLTTTDYLLNNTAIRIPSATIQEMIVNDLTTSIELVDGLEIDSGQRVLPDQNAAKALLARRYLYTEQWDLAETTATDLIDTFGLEPDLANVFLKGSSETIWQFKSGVSPRNTQEANQLIIQIIPGQKYALTESLVAAFEVGDLRFTHWTGSISDSDNMVTLFFSHKYKALLTEMQSLEYSIVFRCAEQYLIRAEARARIGDLQGAKEDIDRIRNRAGLANTTANTLTEVLQAVLHERRVELFAEHGQRWFDIKRTESVDKVLGSIKPNWRPTDILFPIPETELELNPNLLPQNNGY